MNEMIRSILAIHRLDPDAIIHDHQVGDQTAFQVLEAAILDALDTIEQGV